MTGQWVCETCFSTWFLFICETPTSQCNSEILHWFWQMENCWICTEWAGFGILRAENTGLCFVYWPNQVHGRLISMRDLCWYGTQLENCAFSDARQWSEVVYLWKNTRFLLVFKPKCQCLKSWMFAAWSLGQAAQTASTYRNTLSGTATSWLKINHCNPNLRNSSISVLLQWLGLAWRYVNWASMNGWTLPKPTPLHSARHQQPALGL